MELIQDSLLGEELAGIITEARLKLKAKNVNQWWQSTIILLFVQKTTAAKSHTKNDLATVVKPAKPSFNLSKQPKSKRV